MHLVRPASASPLILATNDDGVASAGLLALKRALSLVGEVVVIAPDRDRTGAARSITMSSPLWVEEVALADGSRAFATDGTPVDCVRMGALGLLDRPPDLIVSGVNTGANLGDDITYSGTVAAAFEGIMLDIPAVSVSAEGFCDTYDLEVAAAVATRVAGVFLEAGFPARTLLNVNVPHRSWEELGGIRITTLGKRIYGDQVKLQSRAGRRSFYLIYGDDLSYHDEPDTDFAAVAEGFVSVTPIHFDLTSRDAVGLLSGTPFELGAKPRLPAVAPLTPLPEAVIFDLDGTVVDSVELIVESFRHATVEVLGVELEREQMIANVGKPLVEQMEVLSPDHADQLVRVYREFNHREHDRMLRMYEGMLAVLEGLQARGARMGLVTSKSRPTTEMAFRVTGIRPLLDVVVCAEDTERNKPYPDPIEFCLQRMGAAPDQGVYVGDSPYDLQAAKAAGVRSIGVTWGVFGRDSLEAESPDLVVDSVEDLAMALGVRGLGSV
jgi:5'-nucleotidase